MFDDGITLNSFGATINTQRDGAQLHMYFTINIGEEYEVAVTDARELEQRLTTAIHEIVEDYANDGQEVEVE